MIPFKARYFGRCAACDEQINPGESVEYDDDDELVHRECRWVVPVTAGDKRAPVCTTCWLTKPCGCDDQA